MSLPVFLKTSLSIFLFLVVKFGMGQVPNLDSCGKDASPYLNQFEIYHLDSVLFKPIPKSIKADKGFYYSTKGFDFNNKKIAFFDCVEKQNEGFVAKDKYFLKLKPYYQGPRGIYLLKEDEKKRSGGYDAIIMINCRYYRSKELVEKLSKINQVNKTR